MLTPSKNLPPWVWVSLITNGLLLLTFLSGLVSSQPSSKYSTTQTILYRLDSDSIRWGINQLKSTLSILKIRQTWTYEKWLEQLQEDAEKIADQSPPHLTILLGDSLSAAFPNQLLPRERTWLNQSISGDTSALLNKRLSLLNRTQPQTIFIMIGINDLLRGITEDTILENQRTLIRQWRTLHPRTQLVIQSLLPHRGQKSTWEGKTRLKTVSNQRIRAFNQRLKKLAKNEGVFYLDLHPLFTDSHGDLLPDLTTDGLHLNGLGYLVWTSALKLFSQSQLEYRNTK